MLKAGLTINSTFPSYYIALPEPPVNEASIDTGAVQQSGSGSVMIEQNKILTQNFKTIIFILILGFGANYFLTKR